MNEFNFLAPSALVVKSEFVEKNLIIGLYGGGITPTEFTEYMVKITGQTIKEIWNRLKAWVEEDPNRKWILIILGFILSIPTPPPKPYEPEIDAYITYNPLKIVRDPSRESTLLLTLKAGLDAEEGIYRIVAKGAVDGVTYERAFNLKVVGS